MFRKINTILMVTVLLTVTLFISRPADAELAYGVKADSIKTFNKELLWVGWNGSFSETYNNKCETYNWNLYFSPEGIFAGLTSAESNYSSVDVFASINMFWGYSKAPDTVTWEKATSSYGITYTTDLTIIPNILSLSFGPTVFRPSPTATTLDDAIQFNIGAGFSHSLIDIPLMPSVALDTKSNITKQDTGFWPVLLWNLNPKSTDPVKDIIKALRDLLKSSDTSYIAIHSKQMAGALLPAFTALDTRQSNVQWTGDQITPGDYFGQFRTDGKNSPPSHSIGEMLKDIEQWLTSNDTGAPLKIMKKIPISPASVYGSFKTIKAGVESGFEIAYRHAHDKTVADGGDDNIIYGECIVTTHCLRGDTCIIEVDATEPANMITGKTAGDFEDAKVNFDAAPVDFISSGTVGGKVSDTIKDGKASYSFTSSEDNNILLGVTIPADTAPASGGKTLELCARKVVMFDLIEKENITVIDGKLKDLNQFNPDTLPRDNAPQNFTHGFYTFKVTPDTDKETVKIIIDLLKPVPPGYSWAKYSLTGKKWIDYVNTGKTDKAVISKDRKQVTLTITDNGPFDDDPAVGAISDSSAVALFDINFKSIDITDYITGDILYPDSDTTVDSDSDSKDSDTAVDSDSDSKTDKDDTSEDVNCSFTSTFLQNRNSLINYIVELFL